MSLHFQARSKWSKFAQKICLKKLSQIGQNISRMSHYGPSNFCPKKFLISALAGHGKAMTQTQADCFCQLDGKVDGLSTAE
jgi:hypothetical protein